MQNKFLGSIRTNDNCVGCNKCIRTCSCNGALVAQKTEEGKNRVKVDSTKCIGCGACFDACEHKAFEFIDDTDAFFRDLLNGEQISILVAPSFFANYAENYGEILGGLKEMGVNHVINVAFGADITTWGYVKYIEKYNFAGGISQPCPTVVNYIEKYVPSLIPRLMPIQSPMMCSAIYARNELKIEDKLAFIGPCISKKEEQISKRGKGLISYNVTYENLMKYVNENNISGKCIENEIEHGTGTIYPISGGLKDNIKWYLGATTLVRHIEGEKFLYDYFQRNKELLANSDHPYFMIDALNCTQGCCYGTGIEVETKTSEDHLIKMSLLRKKVGLSDQMVEASKLSPEEKFEKLNDAFSNLVLEDYVCEYTDFSDKTSFVEPSENELNNIFSDMNKLSDESINIRCSCCGYQSCKDMAVAIHNGFTYKDNCVFYIRDEIEKERDKVRKTEIYRELAIRDTHTGLFNRNAFYEFVQATDDFSNYSVLIYDLNNLKQCNDLFGHDVGDIYIRDFATMLKATFADIGITYRVGGDEFLTIFKDADVELVKNKLQILDKYSSEYTLVKKQVLIGISYGYAHFDKKVDESIEETIKRADKFMYENKRAFKEQKMLQRN